MRGYRGQRKDNGEWVYGNYRRHIAYASDDNAIIESAFIGLVSTKAEFEVVPETVGQYTGLKDQNGKVHVYDGDICRALQFGYECIGKVVFWNGCFALTDETSVGGMRPLCQYELEVIGNIHSNPELLE